MLAFIIRRVLQTIVVMVVMSALVFAGIYLIGDPVSMMASPDANEAQRAAIAESMGLNLPIWQQYLVFMAQAVRGNFGNSFLTGAPAMQLILERMPATMELAVVAMLLSLVIGVPLGVRAGLKPKAPGSRAIMTGSVLGFSLPNFWVGMMLIMVFAVKLGWLPASGRGQTVDIGGLRLSVFTLSGWESLALPALTIALAKCATIIRVTRAATREALPMDYIKFARAKGVKEKRVLGVHLLKNILIPIVTVGGLEFGQVVAFAVVTETVFSWPGMGKLLIDSILSLDRPVVVAYLLLVVFFLVMLNLLVDIAYTMLDPRVRAGGPAMSTPGMTPAAAAIAAKEPPAPPVESPFRRFVSEFCASKLALLGLVLLVITLVVAIFAPWLAPQNPFDIGALDIMDSKLPPGSASVDGSITYWLGTDGQARDVLSAIFYGLRTSLLVGVVSVAAAFAIGATVGLIAAYFGGRIDALLMRIADIQLSFPAILVALILLSILGKGVDKVIIALIVAQWAYFARAARGAALVERSKEYVEAVRCMSLGSARILFRHLLPNCMPALIVIATIDLAHAIALEATLSFLGVGVPVTEPSLGMLIYNGYEFLLSGRYWISFFPGIALAIAIIGINLVGDHLRDVLNPRNAA